MNIVGGKNGGGVFQRIISLIPPHSIYIEPFGGSAAILRNKRPARRSVVLDLDPAAIDRLDAERSQIPNLELIVGDGLAYLRRFPFSSSPAVFVYADPPYLRHTRRDPGRDYYAHEWTRGRHVELLKLAARLPCLIMISGYRSSLYESMLQGPGWSAENFPATTRGGPSEEWLWMNYPRPPRLHDYRYIGETFARRWRIHKRQRNWLRMLEKMPPLERRAMLAGLIDAYRDEVLGYLNGGGIPGSATTARGGGIPGSATTARGGGRPRPAGTAPPAPAMTAALHGDPTP